MQGVVSRLDNHRTSHSRDIDGSGAVLVRRQRHELARFDFFEKCGHFPFLSQPREFNQLVEEFLSDATL